MYVISVDSYVNSYILPTTFEHPEDAVAMCVSLAKTKNRTIGNNLMEEESALKARKWTNLFTRKQNGEIDNDYKFSIAEITTPVVKEPATGRFIIDVDGDKINKSTLSEVKAWLDGFVWANDALDEDDWLSIELDLDKEFAIPTEDSKFWVLIDLGNDNPLKGLASIEVTWEATNE